MYQRFYKCFKVLVLPNVLKILKVPVCNNNYHDWFLKFMNKFVKAINCFSKCIKACNLYLQEYNKPLELKCVET